MRDGEEKMLLLEILQNDINDLFRKFHIKHRCEIVGQNIIIPPLKEELSSIQPVETISFDINEAQSFLDGLQKEMHLKIMSFIRPK